MEAKGLAIAPWVRVSLLVGLCFLLASTGWLSWLRVLVLLAGPAQAQALTLVLSYLMQAAGIAVYVVLARSLERSRRMRVALVSVAGYALLIAPATLASDLSTALAFGFLANVACGVMQGYYLTRLAEVSASERRGTAFGCAYGASTLAFAASITLMFLLAYHLYGMGRQTEPVRDQAELLAAFCTAHGLSMRERDVLPLLVDGRTNAEIASELFVTERTVKYHVHNIMEKTGCASRQEVADLYVTTAADY